MVDDAQSGSNHNGRADEGEDQGLSLVLHRGCWLEPQIVKSVKLVEAQFAARPDDTFLVTHPKSGTTWLKALAFAVTSRSHHAAGHPLLTRHPQDVVPFLELPYRQLYPVADLEKLPSPRLLATHMPLQLLPPCVSAAGCRVVYLSREPKDVFVSLWHFVSKVHQDFSLQGAFESFCEGKSAFGPIWEHCLGYWERSKEEPDRFLFLKYEEMIARPEEHVKMLAEFLRVPFTDEKVSRGAVEEVVELCSFQKLKGLPVNTTGAADRVGRVPIENSSYFRAGKAGDWANHLTEEMAEKLDRIVEEKLNGSGLTF